jgi:hypothetical protein
MLMMDDRGGYRISMDLYNIILSPHSLLDNDTTLQVTHHL